MIEDHHLDPPDDEQEEPETWGDRYDRQRMRDIDKLAQKEGEATDD